MRVTGTRDQRAAVVANEQRGRVAWRQMLDAGLTADVVRSMIGSGLLHRRRRGVYAFGHSAPTELADETEALLACGHRAVLSHASAAALWRLTPHTSPAPVHVTVVGSTSGRRRPGITIHRSGTLTARDIRIHSGLPVTSPARALLDFAEDATPRELEIALDEALATRILRRSELNGLLTRTSGRRGKTILRELLARRTTSTLTRSAANERFLQMIRAAALPAAETNVEVCGYEADFYWRELALAYEIDGYQWHSTMSAWNRGRRKDTVFRDAGIELNRVTWAMMDEEPLAIIARLAGQIAERSIARTRAA